MNCAKCKNVLVHIPVHKKAQGETKSKRQKQKTKAKSQLLILFAGAHACAHKSTRQNKK